jgi:hypothetical protein
MTVQTIPGLGVLFPQVPYYVSSSWSFASQLMDASTEKVAMIGLVDTKDHAAKSIRKVGFRTGTVSLDAASAIQISIQSVSTASGPPMQPTGTILGATNNGLVSDAAATFSSNAWHQTGALTEDVSVSPGDLIAVVIEYGTFTAADAINITHLNSPSQQHRSQACLYTGTWAAAAVLPNVLLEFSDGSFGTLSGAFPVSAVSTQSYASNTGGADEYALEFSFPFPVQVDGAMVSFSSSATGADADIVLYDGTTALETVSIDGNTVASTGGTRPTFVPFTQTQSLTANTTYRVALKPTTTTSIALQYLDVSAAGHLQAHSMGEDWTICSRLDAGAWAAGTTTRRPLIFVRVCGFDDAAGGAGGGLIRHPGMNGGLNG